MNQKKGTSNKKQGILIVFDVNETLLDLTALDPLFEKHLGDSKIGKEWFAQVLKSAFTTTILGDYRDFGAVARSALSMIASTHGIELTSDSERKILAGMRRLPPHPDVMPGIKKLHDTGFRMAALTNSPPAVARDQLEHAGVARFMEAVLSVDASLSLKPARIVYDDALQTLGARPENTFLIAAHAWDIAGAMKAGWQGIFLARKGKVWNPLFDSPTFMAGDLHDAADWIIPQRTR